MVKGKFGPEDKPADDEFGLLLTVEGNNGSEKKSIRLSENPFNP